jgi:hypothetical protein
VQPLSVGVCQFLIVAALVYSLPGCGKTSQSHEGSETIKPAPQVFLKASTDHKLPSVKIPAQDQTETLAWLEAAREDPDPRVRLHAIETWSQKPGDTLDPATHAMVDPDETVRARAQQLFEEALARK